MKEFIFELLKTKSIMWWIMALGIFLLSQLLKLPIKHFTKRLREPVRKRVNSVILLIPLLLGVGCAFLYDMILMPKLGEPAIFSITDGIILGSQSIAFYGVFERFLGKKITNPYETPQGQRVINKANEIVEDGYVSKDEAKELFVDSVLTDDEQQKIKEIININQDK